MHGSLEGRILTGMKPVASESVGAGKKTIVLGKRLKVMVKIAGEACCCRWRGGRCVGMSDEASSGIAGSACWSGCG